MVTFALQGPVGDHLLLARIPWTRRGRLASSRALLQEPQRDLQVCRTSDQVSQQHQVTLRSSPKRRPGTVTRRVHACSLAELPLPRHGRWSASGAEGAAHTSVGLWPHRCRSLPQASTAAIDTASSPRSPLDRDTGSVPGLKLQVRAEQGCPGDAPFWGALGSAAALCAAVEAPKAEAQLVLRFGSKVIPHPDKVRFC